MDHPWLPGPDAKGDRSRRKGKKRQRERSATIKKKGGHEKGEGVWV